MLIVEHWLRCQNTAEIKRKGGRTIVRAYFHAGKRLSIQNMKGSRHSEIIRFRMSEITMFPGQPPLTAIDP